MFEIEKMGQHNDLHTFDKSQILMTWLPSQTISSFCGLFPIVKLATVLFMHMTSKGNLLWLDK